MKKITLLVPVFNEETNLPRLANALNPLIGNEMTPEPYNWEVMLVNDGSRDNSLEVMKALHLTDSRFNYLNLSRNFGKENAMLAGLDYASGDAVVILDADLQHPIDVIPQMITEWGLGYDDVYGRRGTRGKETFLRHHLTSLFYRILKQSSRMDVLPNVGDFRLLDRKCVNAIRRIRETQRYSKGLFSWIGFRKKEVIFNQGNRINGKSSFSILSLINLAIDGITSFTTAPLRLASIVGVVTAFITLIYLVFVLIKAILYGDPVAGYPTIMCVMLFLGGCQLIALGIIGEYVARIFIESKNRPPYIVESLNGKDI